MSKPSLVTDIKEAKMSKDVPENVGEPLLSDQLNFKIDLEDSIFNQYTALHGTIAKRIVKKIELSGMKLGHEEFNFLLHSVQNVLQQEVIFGILKKIGVEDITDVVSESKQDEIVALFDMTKSLDNV